MVAESHEQRVRVRNTHHPLIDARAAAPPYQQAIGRLLCYALNSLLVCLVAYCQAISSTQWCHGEVGSQSVPPAPAAARQQSQLIVTSTSAASVTVIPPIKTSSMASGGTAVAAPRVQVARLLHARYDNAQHNGQLCKHPLTVNALMHPLKIITATVIYKCV
jgi:hypothetical protein